MLYRGNLHIRWFRIPNITYISVHLTVMINWQRVGDATQFWCGCGFLWPPPLGEASIERYKIFQNILVNTFVYTYRDSFLCNAMLCSFQFRYSYVTLQIILLHSTSCTSLQFSSAMASQGYIVFWKHCWSVQWHMFLTRNKAGVDYEIPLWYHQLVINLWRISVRLAWGYTD